MKKQLIFWCAAFMAIAASPASYAGSENNPDILAIRRQLVQQQKAIAQQAVQLEVQQRLIASLEKQMIDHNKVPVALNAETEMRTKAAQAADSQAPAAHPRTAALPGTAAATVLALATTPSSTSSNPADVGQAPEESKRPPKIEAIASVGGVLTRKGTIVVEPYAEYVHTSLNQFTFEGVQIIDAVLIGAINAGTTQQDLGLGGLALRYGVTDRLEIETRVPYVYRTQSFTGMLLNSNNDVLHQSAHGSGLGDVEGAIHYQINDGSGGLPFFIGNLRYKSDTGTGPWDVTYSANGLAQTLPTGSGFAAINPSLTVIYPTDPGVLYGNLGWIRNFADNRSLSVNQAIVSQIRPGDTYSGSFGIGISLNDLTSFSIGYEQDYIQATTELVNGSQKVAQSLLAGELSFGFTLNTSNRNSYNLGLNVGVTRDAPDVALTLRTPFSFDQPSF